MRTIRALYRLTFLCVMTSVLYVIWIGRIPFLKSARRSPWRGVMVGFWARRALKLFGVRTHIKGVPPEPPFFLVSNHLSYLDIVLYQSQVPCVFMAKSEVASWPVIGWLAREIGTLFIRRSSKHDVVRANNEIEMTLAKGDSVVLFPEGTSSKGDGVLPFKTALFSAVSGLKWPIYHAAVSYKTPESERPASEVVCWWGDMTFTDHFFNMLKLPTFDATIVFGQDTLQAEDRKVMAAQLNERVARNFIPVA